MCLCSPYPGQLRALGFEESIERMKTLWGGKKTIVTVLLCLIPYFSLLLCIPGALKRKKIIALILPWFPPSGTSSLGAVTQLPALKWCPQPLVAQVESLSHLWCLPFFHAPLLGIVIQNSTTSHYVFTSTLVQGTLASCFDCPGGVLTLPITATLTLHPQFVPHILTRGILFRHEIMPKSSLAQNFPHLE